MNPSDLISVCMAVPRRYRNYNEQTQAEMDRFYGKEGSGEVRSKPTYMDYEPVKKQEPVVKDDDKQEYLPNVRINGQPATPKAAGIFLTIFGLFYILFSVMMGAIMVATGAPLFALGIISVFFIVGVFIAGIGIHFLRKSAR